MREINHYQYNNTLQTYKNLYECTGLNCSNKAACTLRIKYINNISHFCQQCTDNPLQSKVGEKILGGST